MERRPLIIIGSGPAGSATALFLQRQNPALAGDALVLDKARHPREKTCAGGLIPHTLACLDELGVPLRVPNVAVHTAGVLIPSGRAGVPPPYQPPFPLLGTERGFGGRSVIYEDRDLCRVVRRDEFDAALADACRRRGVEIRADERVVDVARDGSDIRVQTERE